VTEAAGTPSEAPLPLTDEQRRIVAWRDGPLVVIAGAGTGKTRVIVERVRWLLANVADLMPEQVLVLTYNVKAARELAERLEAALGPAVRSRVSVSNFHSFCQRVLTESAADAGLPAQPDVLDGVGQMLLLRDLRAGMPLVYFSGSGNPYWSLGEFVGFINRAKDELVSPDDFEAFVDEERRVFQARYGSLEHAVEQLQETESLKPVRQVRSAYADLRRRERAAEADPSAPAPEPDLPRKTAEREARRAVLATGGVLRRDRFDTDQLQAVDGLADTYLRDGAALEVVRLAELSLVFRSYQEELVRRGALDFGEQIAAVTALFKRRPNVLRRYQKQFRYLLVDEFQDANIAQIELIELLGRTPDRPDNVMVVGDDDQSIYRFRGASFAAFAEFERRFAMPPAHDVTGPAPGPPPRLRIERNFRSRPPILIAANRLIAHNAIRFEPDKRLAPARDAGDPVEVVTCAGPDDEAVAIVERIRALAAWDPGIGGEPAIPWSSFAVLYRKHRHRDAIVARLREASIPYVVSGGISLFATPEVRDLEQALRAIADPLADAALIRMLTAGPWRLDALELLTISRQARRMERPLVEIVREVVDAGEVEQEVVGAEERQEPADSGPIRREAALAALRARLRGALELLDELHGLSWREGPFTILERFVERSGQIGCLLALDTLEAKRTIANIASLLRFASDWQREHPVGTLAAFVDYLDAYQGAGGELPTSVEVAEDSFGVRLMTLYQAKGLEYPVVFIPRLLKDEWPTREMGFGLFPRELLREAVPSGDVHGEEERRLLYVAMTRAQERLILTTHGGPLVQGEASPFLAELAEGAGRELLLVDRVAVVADPGNVQLGEPGRMDAAPLDEVLALPSPRERRHALRVRATELLRMLEGVEPSDPEADLARRDLLAELTRVGEAAIATADAARAAGLDPLTLHVIAADAGAGADLLRVVPLPARFSYSAFSVYEECPMRYAFRYLYRLPGPPAVAAFSFGSTAHAAFEAFTRERRERMARDEPMPTRDDLERLFTANWTPDRFPDRISEETYHRRVRSLLDTFWEGELSTVGAAIHEELAFELRLDPRNGDPPVMIGGSIDRVDRLPSGGIEVIDYKTGKQTSQKDVDQNLQLSIYALACRDALELGTPEQVTLYFTEAGIRQSTARTDVQLDAAREDLLARAARIRSGDFAATPSQRACGRCDYRVLCPSQA
jgi:DNA helicase II / ATP-dependent DNA helicase PcrA